MVLAVIATGIASVGTGAKHQGFKGVHGRVGKKRILKLCGPIFSSEEQPQGMLGYGLVSPHTAVHPEPGVDLKALLIKPGVDQFNRDRTLPYSASPARVGVNVQIFCVGDNRERRDRLEIIR
jgi:hypothetical protein